MSGGTQAILQPNAAICISRSTRKWNLPTEDQIRSFVRAPSYSSPRTSISGQVLQIEAPNPLALSNPDRETPSVEFLHQLC